MCLQVKDRNDVSSSHSGQAAGLGGYHIENLVPGPAEVTASFGSRSKNALYTIRPGANTLDFRFAPGGATLNCAVDLDRAAIFRVSYYLTVDTVEGQERITGTMQSLTPSGLGVVNLPEGRGTFDLVVYFTNGQRERMFSSPVELVSGATTSIPLPGAERSAAVTITLEGVDDSMYSRVHLLRGEVDLSGMAGMTPLEYESWDLLRDAAGSAANAEGACYFDHLEPGVYTILALAWPKTGEVTPDAFPRGFRTATAVENLDSETEHHVILTLP